VADDVNGMKQHNATMHNAAKAGAEWLWLALRVAAKMVSSAPKLR